MKNKAPKVLPLDQIVAQQAPSTSGADLLKPLGTPVLPLAVSSDGVKPSARAATKAKAGVNHDNDLELDAEYQITQSDVIDEAMIQAVTDTGNWRYSEGVLVAQAVTGAEAGAVGTAEVVGVQTAALAPIAALPVSAVLGGAVVVGVAASGGGGDSPAATVNTSPTGSVTLSGTTTQGQVLTAANTLADADGLGTISYKWQVSTDGSTNWTDISGATVSTLTLAEAQVGKYVRSVASYTDGHSTAESVASSASTVVVNVNDAPTGTSNTLTMLQGGSKTFAAADFGFADAADSTPNTLSAVKITTLPAAGTLTLGGVAVTLNQVIAAASLGTLVYTPAVGASGAGYASIGFKVQDNGGTANGGVDTSVAAYTLTFDVQSTAAPTAAVNAITALSADTGVATDFITNQASQTVTGTFTGTLALGETIQVSANGGTTWINATVSGQTWTATGVTLGNGASQLITQTHSAGGANLAGTGHNYTLDTATTAPSFSLTTGTTLSGQSVINGTSEPGATVTVTIAPDNNAGTINSFSYAATADGTGVWSVNLATAQPSTGTASFSSGTAAISAVQIDVAGNPSTATTATFTSSNATSYAVLGPTDILGAQLLDANNLPLGVDEGAGVIRFVVLRSGDTSTSGTVTYTTQNGTATAGSDYTATSGTVTFATGETFKIITVNIADDATVETNETLSLRLTAATGGNITTATATATINDNEQSVWSVASAGNVDEAAGFMTYTVTRTGASAAATISFATAGGSATAGVDYTATNQVLSFASGELSKTVQVAVINDSVAEGNETVVASISAASSGSILTNTATATINDNDQSNWSVVSAGTVDEGSGFITYTVNRTGASAAASISFAITGGTATVGADYTAANQVLTFAAGELSKTVQVAVLNDIVAEGNETVIASISGASAGSIVTGTATSTINDNDQSNWSVASIAAVDEGAGFITYTVSRTGASAAATISFATAGGTATAGADYTAANQVLTFAAGEMSKTVQVAVNDDNVAEGNETVVGVITGASSGNIVTGTTSVTVNDNETSVWSVSSAGAVDEGAGFITYTVNRTGASAAATISFATAGGTASAGSDYTAANQVLNFAAGEMSKTVQVAIVDDNLMETNETVSIAISNQSMGTISAGAASSTILDNEMSIWSIASLGDVNEAAGFISYEVTRTGATGAATVNFDTTLGTASPGVDYTGVHQILNFAVGETRKLVVVPILQDLLAEVNETLTANISNVSSGNILQGAATANIVDDDLTVWNLSVANQVSEAAGFVSFNISRSGDLNSAASINFATSGGSATAGVDYTPLSQTLNFAAGEINKTVLVALTDDVAAEVPETLIGLLSNASVGEINTPSKTTVIIDNDQTLWSVSGTLGTSEDAGYMIFAVSRLGPTDIAATVNFRTAGGSAAAGIDYTAVNQTLSFAAGEVSKVVLVPILNDNTVEQEETVIGIISDPTTGNIFGATGTGSIAVNDASVWLVQGNSSAESAGSLTYTITRTDGSSAATVRFLTSSSDSTAGSGYTAINQMLSFAVGEVSKTVILSVADDANSEAQEGIYGYIIDPSNGILWAGTGGKATASILNDDASRVNFSISATTNNATESSGLMAYTITRSGVTTGVDSVDWSTLSGGSATVGSDFTASNGTVTFAAGETKKVVWVPLINDAAIEANETLTVGLSNASKGAIVTTTATATIVDDDSTASVGSNTYAVSVLTVNPIESAGAVGYQISRSGDLTQVSTSYFRTNGGTAQTDGSDYVVNAGQTLNWAVGETTKVVFVALVNDGTVEANETIIGQSASNSGYTTGVANSTATILDDDVTLGSNTYSVTYSYNIRESAGETIFTVTRGGDLTQSSVSYFRTTAGSALAGNDYTAITSQTLSWQAGETTKQIAVHLTNDSVSEQAEYFYGESSALADFSTMTNAFSVIMDDDLWTATAGVNDVITEMTPSGSYTGGYVIDTSDGNDVLTLGASTQYNITNIVLGSGSDTLITHLAVNMLVSGAHYDGGSGVDTLTFGQADTYDFIGAAGASTGDMFKHFEILDMSGAGNQTIKLSLSDVLEMTNGNSVVDTIRITGNSGDSLSLQTLGKTLSTVSAGTGNLTDVDGATYNVVASAAGNVNANDVTIGGATYDVYQYNYDGHVMKLLVATAITTTVI